MKEFICCNRVYTFERYCTQKDQKLHTILAFLSAIGLKLIFFPSDSSITIKLILTLRVNLAF